MYYYYRYIFTNKDLKIYNVWAYSQKIINALELTYKNNLISVDFSYEYYGFWLNREKGQHEHSKAGKIIASSISDFNKKKSTYTYTCSDGTPGISTQIFHEDKSKRKIQATI
ncbi:hypothetical protein [Clostridium ihumii]|uniref:hypothetical protein n=1 Tax=Clostridium ihumii TaxID=1470356 RepID=UPI0005552C1B|nr:hypothetical protein [Clostridium ihumii]